MSEDETTSNPAMLQRIGDYEILGVLGAGGMGKVYKVRNVLTERIEAMKILLPDLVSQKELADRFLREIKVLAGLSHPNIASLRTALTVGHQLVMIMELVEGVTLAARLEQGALPPADAVDYIDQVLAALSYAHGQHIIHRDVKPANMMLTPQGVVKLMDFGIARAAQDRGLTMTGTTLGSLYYMSPEQIRGETVDARSDLYSVGVSLYELVVGSRPFQATANYSIMAAHLQEAPKPPTELRPGLPMALDDVILMAMAKDSAQRFQSADAFRNALNSIRGSLGSEPGVVSAQPPSAGPVGATAVFQASTTGTGSAGLAASPPQPPFQPAAQPSVSPVPWTVPGSQPQPESLPAAPPLPRPSPAIQPVPAPAMRGAYRGLYMTLGALVVVAVLVAAGLYGPRWAKTRASGGSAQPTSQPPSSAVPPSVPANNPAAAANAQPSFATSSDSGTLAGSSSAGGQPPSNPPLTGEAGAGPNQPVGEPSQIHGRKAAPTGVPPRVQTVPNATVDSSNSPSAGTPQGNQTQQAGSTPTPQAPAPDSVELDKLQDELDQLSSRARAVRDSVETLRRQQNAQGLNLRGDIAAAEDRMGSDIDKAQAALQNQNAKDARRYMEKAEAEVETLEKFLGRR